MIPQISKILYTTDLSQNSVYAFRYALSSAEKYDAQVDILYVIKSFQSLSDLEAPAPGASEKELASLKEEIKKKVNAVLQEEVKGRPNIMSRVSSIQAVEGDPTIQILQKVEELKPDLLIMGTHSKGIIAHTFLGSVAHQVLQRVRIPVAVVPLPEKP